MREPREQTPVINQHHQRLKHAPIDPVRLLPEDWPQDVPLVRMHTCGCSPLQIEVLQRFDGPGRYDAPSYAPPHEHAWQQVKGRRTAMALLSFLVSQPGCHATHDALAQALRPGHAAALRSEEDEEDDHALQRVDNLVSDLRRLLFPPALASLPAEQQRAIRKAILRGVKASRDSGVSYVLASLPLVWLDVEMMEHYARQAMSRSQASQRDLQAWRTVSELGLRGMFLPHECYSDWSTWRRTHVRELLWQSIRAQMPALDQEPDQQTSEEVLRLLSAYWYMEPTNEDAFRALAERLLQESRYQQAEECYQELRAALSREGKSPHERTEEVMAFGGIAKRQQKVASHMVPLIEIASQSHPFSHRPISLPFSPDPSLGIMKQSDISGDHHMDSSRRGFLQALFAAGLAVSSSGMPHALDEYLVTRHISDESLRGLESMTTQMRCMQRQGDVSLYQGLQTHITLIQGTLEKTVDDTPRSKLWSLLAQTYILTRFELKGKHSFARMKTLNEAAISAARNSGDTILTAAAIGHLAHLYLREVPQEPRIFQLLAQAQELAQRDAPLQGWLCLLLASLAAREGKRQKCESLLMEAREIASSSSTNEDRCFTDFNPTSANVFASNCWLVLGVPMRAYQLLGATDVQTLSPNRQASAYYDVTRAFAAAGEMEMAQRYAIHSMNLALATQNHYILPRFLTLSASIQRDHPQDPYASAMSEYAQYALSMKGSEVR